GLNSPLFDTGMSVTAGSFTVDGVTISVAANDTINTVISKINAATTGVTATYDDTAQTVKLTANEESSTPVTVGNDTSGFLAAVKLDQTAQSTTGMQSMSPLDAA